MAKADWYQLTDTLMYWVITAYFAVAVYGNGAFHAHDYMLLIAFVYLLKEINMVKRYE